MNEKKNAFKQGKFSIRSRQKFIFEPFGLYRIGLVAFQRAKVTRAYKAYGIHVKWKLKLKKSFPKNFNCHLA